MLSPDMISLITSNSTGSSIKDSYIQSTSMLLDYGISDTSSLYKLETIYYNILT
jgi:hypothetical protein